MSNVKQILKNLTNLQNKATLTIGAVAASVGGYYTASQFKQNNIQSTPQTLEAIRNVASQGTPLEQCKANTLPSFINHSLSWPDNNGIISEAFESLSPPSIIVTAAGNDRSKPVSRTTVNMSKNANAIVVGSIAPDGNISDFSAPHEEVHILAPSDRHLISANEDGSRKSFSGTSGATALVTGSLAGFEWLSGYHPTAEEAKILLEKTAIPTLSANDNPRRDGVGMVNAYKLGMVGKLLKEACGTDVSCFKEKIKDDSTYDTSSSIPSSLLTEVEEAFPQCSSTMCRNTSTAVCRDKSEVFKKLRKAAFLKPEDKNLWRMIACIYESNEFSENASGAMSTYRALFETTSDTYIDKSCTSNADCAYVPHCGHYEQSGDLMYLVANKNFVMECQGKILCNGGCRCESTEEYASASDSNVIVVRQARCENSVCVDSTTRRNKVQSQTNQAPPKIESETQVIEEDTGKDNTDGSQAVQ